MLRRRVSLALLWLILVGCGDNAARSFDAPVAGDAPPELTTLRVLFIGNSYTYVNDLPGMLARIAATSGVSPAIEVDQVTVGGARLMDHWEQGLAAQRIAEGGWTHVVLQGQSFEPAADYFNDYLVERGEFEDGAQRLRAAVVAAGARPTWFVTWARAAGDEFYSYRSYSTPDMLQDGLTSAYVKVAHADDVLSCVGEAFRRSLRQHPEIVLHDADRSHPSVAGTYLAAGTFYVALTGRPVPGASEVPPGLDAGDATALREIAGVGTDCRDVRALGHVMSDSIVAYGDAGVPVSGYIYLANHGDSPAEVADAGTLAPPFSWTTGDFPGFAGATDEGTPACAPVLPPKSECAVAVSYSGAVTATGELVLNVTGAYNTAVHVRLDGTHTDQSLLSFRLDPATTQFIDGRRRVTAAPGETAEFHAVMMNRGGATATSITKATGPFPLAPFTWGLVGGAPAYPGGDDTRTIDGVTYARCAGELAPGERCVVTGRFSPTAPTSQSSTFSVRYDAGARVAGFSVTGVSSAP